MAQSRLGLRSWPLYGNDAEALARLALARTVIILCNQHAVIEPGCVKTLRGITAPGILGSTVTRRGKKRKNLSSARHYDQIRFRFHTAKTVSDIGPAAQWEPTQTIPSVLG